MRKTHKTSREDKAKTVLISFKVSQEIYNQLELYSNTQTDEAGLTLSPSLGARRLMLEGLRKAKFNE
jgi:hypothetical protein